MLPPVVKRKQQLVVDLHQALLSSSYTGFSHLEFHLNDLISQTVLSFLVYNCAGFHMQLCTGEILKSMTEKFNEMENKQ